MPTFAANNTLASGLATLAKSLFPDPNQILLGQYRRAAAQSQLAHADYYNQRTEQLQRANLAFDRASRVIASAQAEGRPVTQADMLAIYSHFAGAGEDGLKHGPGFVAGLSGLSDMDPLARSRVQSGAGMPWQNTEQGNLTKDIVLPENHTAITSPDRAAAMGLSRPVVQGQRSASPGETVVPAAGSGQPTIYGVPTEQTARGGILTDAYRTAKANPDTPLPAAIAQLATPQVVVQERRNEGNLDVQKSRNEGNLDVQKSRNEGNLDVQNSKNEGNLNVQKEKSETQKTVADLLAASRERIAQTNGEARMGAAQINADGRRDSAQITGDSRVEAARIGADGRRDSAQITGDSRVEAARVNADGRRDSAQITGDSRVEAAKARSGSTAAPAIVRGKDQDALAGAFAKRFKDKYGVEPSDEMVRSYGATVQEEFQRTRSMGRAVDNVLNTLPPKEELERSYAGWGKAKGFKNPENSANPPAAAGAAPAQPPATAAPAVPSGNAPNNAIQTQQYKEGQTATNRQTGERMIFRNGRWERL